MQYALRSKEPIMTPEDNLIAASNLQLIRGGKAYFDLLTIMIRKAKRSFHLQVYIYDEDETGRMIAEELKAAVKRGVDVWILADGYGSKALSKAFVQSLKEAGINFRWFAPLFRWKYYYFGRRLHHKIAVADENYSLTGGINISDKYNDLPGKPAWLDWALYAEGTAAQQLALVCAERWNKAGWSRKKNIKIDIKKDPTVTKGPLRIRINDWVRGRNEISVGYMGLLLQAKKEVIIMSGYFMPGETLKYYLKACIKRGVKVTVITTGISDVPIAKYAERHCYGWLLKNGIRLAEYSKTVLHGKISVADDMLMTVGSYNINNISAYASIELNIEVQSASFVKNASDILRSIIQNDCTEITEQQLRISNNIFKRMGNRIAYEVIRLLIFVFTFYFRKNKAL